MPAITETFVQQCQGEVKVFIMIASLGKVYPETKLEGRYPQQTKDPHMADSEAVLGGFKYNPSYAEDM